MRVLRLDLPDGPVELHPYVTVLRGLQPGAREALLEALSSVPRGQATTSGLVEAHGVLLDLDDESLSVLDLHSGVDAVIRPGDLPGLSGGARLVDAERQLADAEARAAAAEAAVDVARRALDAARRALEAAREGSGGGPDVLAGPRDDLDARTRARLDAERAVEAAAAAEHDAARAVIDADAAADAARAARADATRAVAAAAAELEAAGERRDPVAGAVLEAARARLADAEAAVVAARAAEERGEVTSSTPPSDEEIAALRAERVEAEAAVLALETGDPSPIRLALEQLRAGAAMEPVPDPKALDLADQWGALQAELVEVGAGDELDDLIGAEDGAAARARLAAAEAALAVAEASLRPSTPEAGDLRALEAAHAEVLEAKEAYDRRFRRAGASKRLAQAEAAERELLEQLGFATFTDYLMGQRKGSGEDVVDIDEARSELQAASQAAEQIDAAMAAELRRAELLDRRRALKAAAIELLGDDPGPDVVGALRRRRVPATETGGHLARLRSALEATGLVFDDEVLPERTLIDLATVWLEEQERAAEERVVLEQRMTDLEARLAEANRLRAAAGVGGSGGAPTALAAGLAAVDQARAAVAQAEARFARHQETEEAVEVARRAFAAAAERELTAVAALAEAEAACVDRRVDEREAAAAAVADLNQATAAAARAATAVQEARAAVAAAGDHTAPVGRGAIDTEDAEWFLLARLAGQRAVSFAGSVPMVLDDALAGFDVDPTKRLLDRLERMSSTVQLVFVTEDLTTAAWAEAIGPDRAAIVQR